MSIEQFEIQLIAAVVAAACALPGVFLVLRRMAMISDAISHTVLLGIVGGFLIAGDLDNPLLIVGAAFVGVLTVVLVEVLNKTRLVKQDAAIGLVFPALFSLAVILISIYARNVHLDEHTVFQGDLLFAPFDRFVIGGVDLGPRTLVIMSVILLLNISLISLFFKELKLTTFDPGLAAALGFAPAAINYGLVTLVSVTAVGAFDAVGSILVVALMIIPATTAYLLTDNLKLMMGLAVLFGAVSGVGGYWFARLIDTNISAAIVAVLGMVFTLTFIFAPERGMVSLARRRKRQKWEFARDMLLVHLLNHKGEPDEDYENRIHNLVEHFRWEPDFAEKVVRYCENYGLIVRRNAHLYLTGEGLALAENKEI